MNLDLLIPTYSRSQLLLKCLESVCRANRPPGMNIRVVVVDNNSKDNTRDVVQPFLQHPDLTFQYLFVQRPGKSAALNEALAQTHAEIVGMIDDDEQIDPAWFEVAHRELSGDPTLDYIGGPYHPHWEIPLPDDLPPVSIYGSGLGIILRPQRVAFSPAFGGILMGGNIAIRRATLEKVLPYPEKLGKIEGRIRSGQDEAIHYRLLKIGAHGVSVPDLIIYHWIPASRLTKKYYRTWALSRGIGEGYQLRERGPSPNSLLGIPRFKYRDALRGARSMLMPTSPHERFLGELILRDFIGILYGRHLYGRVE